MSVLIVFMVHAGVAGSPGPLGVTVFFFLSGYLITTLLRMEFERTGTISLRNFYLRRAFRILPPLYLVLGGAYALTLLGVLGAQRLRLGACLSQVFFLGNYQILASGWAGTGIGRPPGTGSLWSLAVEEHFYLLFPVCYLLLCRFVPSRRRQAMWLGGVCALVLVWRCVLILGLHHSFDRTYAASDTRIDSILFGCILAVIGNPVLDWSRPSSRESPATRWTWAGLTFVGIVAMVVTFRLRDPRITGTLQYTVDGVALIPLFVLTVRYHDWGAMRLLNLRPVMFVGAISYSVYILHEIVIAAVHHNVSGSQALHGVIYLVVTLGIAWSIFRWVERPFARLRRRLTSGNATAASLEAGRVRDARAGASRADRRTLVGIPALPAAETPRR